MNPTDYQPQEAVHGHAPDERLRFRLSDDFDDSLRLDWLRSAAADTLTKPLGLTGTFGIHLTEISEQFDWYWPSITITLNPELSVLDVLRLVAQDTVPLEECFYFYSLEIDATARTMCLEMQNQGKTWIVFGCDIEEAAKAIVGLTFSRPVPDMADRLPFLHALLKADWGRLDEDDLNKDDLDEDDLAHAACVVAEMFFGPDDQGTEHGRDWLIIRATLQQVFTERRRQRIIDIQQRLASQHNEDLKGTVVSGPNHPA